MKELFQGRAKWIGLLCFIGILFALAIYRYNAELAAKSLGFYALLHDPHRLKEVLISYGPFAPFIFILIQIAQVIVAPIPGGAIEFMGGYFFGTKAGLIYSMIGLVIGSWMAFSLARMLEKWAIEKLVSAKTFKKFDYLVGHEGVILSFLLFLLPCFPKDALCYILGLTPMGVGTFLLVSTLGRIPGTMMATLQGAKAFDHQYVTLLILSGLSALIILIFYVHHDAIHKFLKKMAHRNGPGGTPPRRLTHALDSNRDLTPGEPD
jgi:uncharacterized membrane protein YdjX (TVP38/TMEM64 family)